MGRSAIFPASFLRSRAAVLVLALQAMLAGQATEAMEPGRIGATATEADLTSLRLAIEDLTETGGDRYPGGPGYLRRLDRLAEIPEAERLGDFLKLKEEALLANPLLDFEQLLLINRAAGNLALPQNWQSNSSLKPTGHDNEIMVLSPVSPRGRLTTLYRPGKSECITDLDLHFDGERVLFSMPDCHTDGPRHVSPMGIHRHPARILPTHVHDESGRHPAGELVRHEFLLAQRHVLQPPDPRERLGIRHGRRGHHDQPRMGQLVVFDTSKGRREAEGVVQRIPGRGQVVEPVLLDGLTQNKCPRFLRPFPLSEKYFLVSCQPTNRAPWGIYLVDVFDNFLLLCEEPGRALMEPIPVRRTPLPPVIASQVVPGEKEATVVISDVYLGEGLRGVPRGAIKSLRGMCAARRSKATPTC